MNEFTFVVYDFNYLTPDDLWEWVDQQTICELVDIRMEPDEVICTPRSDNWDEFTLQELKADFIDYFNTY